MLYENEDNYAFIDGNNFYEFNKNFKTFTASKRIYNAHWKISKYSKEVMKFYVIFYDIYGIISINEEAILTEDISVALEHLLKKDYVKEIKKVWDAQNYRYITKKELEALYPELFF